jgi:tRNA(Leu) C34 or U34 (ribose-2'-O)-methylase TrmL
LTHVTESSLWLFTTKTDRPVWDAPRRHHRHRGPRRLQRHRHRPCIGVHTLPMMPGERSLNVATAVCAAVYEGMRQVKS